jgi:signal transduction histidine kinase
LLVDVDGRELPVIHQIQAHASGQGGGHFYSFIARDNSERKAHEADRDRLLLSERKARLHAEAINRLRDEFLVTVTHELRTPLAGIEGQIQLLASGGLSPEKQKSAFLSVLRNVRLETRLVNDLLDASQALQGVPSLELRILNVLDSLRNSIESQAGLFSAKGIQLELHCPEEPHLLEADGHRLEQVFSNILSNALKFTPPGGRVDVRARTQENEIVLSFTDTGIGVDPAFLSHVFEKFRQEDASLTRAYGGLGLGLFLSKEIINAHGGFISASSPGRDKGTTLEVRLPLLARVSPKRIP